MAGISLLTFNLFTPTNSITQHNPENLYIHSNENVYYNNVSNTRVSYIKIAYTDSGQIAESSTHNDTNTMKLLQTMNLRKRQKVKINSVKLQYIQ